MFKSIYFSLVLSLIIIAQPMKAQMENSEDKKDKSLSPYFFVQSEGAEVDQLPLLSTSAEVSVIGVIADVTVRQVYKNSGKKPLEAIYIFPASTRAAVYGLIMKIGERTLTAKIEKREEARQIYETAKSEGKSASLLEQQRPNVFQMNVANILPGDIITVELKYTEMLIPENSLYEFIYPTVVGPRYSNKPSDSASSRDKFVETPFRSEGEKPDYTFNIKISLASGVPIDNIFSSSHNVKIVKNGEKQATITLDDQDKFSGNKDFILKYSLSGGKIETGLILSEIGNENFFLLMLQPPKRVLESEIPKREYVFILDVSGSMNGFPLDVSKKLIGNLLAGLKPDDKFNILFFAGGFSLLSDSSLTVTPDNIAKATEMLRSHKGGGGTELLPALNRAFSLPKSDGYSRTFVISTDGYIDIEKETFKLINDNLDNSNVFIFGIGSSVNRYLVEGIARVGRGEPFIVTNENEADSVATRFLHYISSPVMTGIKVEYQGFDVYDVEPGVIPDVFAARPIIIFGKYRKPTDGFIKVTGNTGLERLTVTIPVILFGTPDTSSALKYLWARNRLATLSDFAAVSTPEENKQEIIDLGLKYNLLTAHTSFVAVDEDIRRKDKNLETVKQPLPMPEGVSDLAVGGYGYGNALSRSSGVMMYRSSSPLTGASKASESTADISILSRQAGDSVSNSNPVDSGPTYDQKSLDQNLIYPDWAKECGFEGTVTIRVIIDKNGRIISKSVLKSECAWLDDAALESVAKLKLTPSISNRRPTQSSLDIPVRYRIANTSNGKFLCNVLRQGKIASQEIIAGSGKTISEGDDFSIRAWSTTGKKIDINKLPDGKLTFLIKDKILPPDFVKRIGIVKKGSKILIAAPYSSLGGLRSYLTKAGKKDKIVFIIEF